MRSTLYSDLSLRVFTMRLNILSWSNWRHPYEISHESSLFLIKKILNNGLCMNR